jgi:hypothetical protein
MTGTGESKGSIVARLNVPAIFGDGG